MRTILSVLVLASCQGAKPSQTVDGFPLPVPPGTEIVEVRAPGTANEPRHVDAELEARVTGDAEAIASFFVRELTGRGMTMERTEHDRVDREQPAHPKLKRVKAKLIRLVGTRGDTRVHVIITMGRESHKLQIAVAGPL